MINDTVNMSPIIEKCIICLEPVSNTNDIKKKIHPGCDCRATIDQRLFRSMCSFRIIMSYM